tara:strand:- start:5 stop:673 length:669 start_codon:yes stop_codon:yes gene_type:complete
MNIAPPSSVKIPVAIPAEQINNVPHIHQAVQTDNTEGLYFNENSIENNGNNGNNENNENNIFRATHYIETMPEELKLQNAWRYGKTTKLLSMIDSFFCIFAGLFTNPFMIIVAIMPIMGYYGAKEYNIYKIFIYCMYIFIIFAYRIITTYYIGMRKYDYLKEYTDGEVAGVVFFSLFCSLVELWILWVVLKFYNYLLRLTDHEKNRLQVGTYIPVVHTYQFY